MNIAKQPKIDTHKIKKEGTLLMKKKTPKQIAAIICIILLVALYIATLVVALLDFPGKEHLFAACLMASIGLPILLWITMWSVKKFKQRED